MEKGKTFFDITKNKQLFNTSLFYNDFNQFMNESLKQSYINNKIVLETSSKVFINI